MTEHEVRLEIPERHSAFCEGDGFVGEAGLKRQRRVRPRPPKDIGCSGLQKHARLLCTARREKGACAQIRKAVGIEVREEAESEGGLPVGERNANATLDVPHARGGNAKKLFEGFSRSAGIFGCDGLNQPRSRSDRRRSVLGEDRIGAGRRVRCPEEFGELEDRRLRVRGDLSRADRRVDRCFTVTAARSDLSARKPQRLGFCVEGRASGERAIGGFRVSRALVRKRQTTDHEHVVFRARAGELEFVDRGLKVLLLEGHLAPDEVLVGKGRDERAGS